MFQSIKNLLNLKIIYKLLNDFLLALLIFFFLVMVSEGILFGIISRYIPIYVFILIILVDVLAISYIGKKLQITEHKFSNKKTTWLVLAASALFLINSILKINYYLIPVIIIVSLISIYYLYQILGEEN